MQINGYVLAAAFQTEDDGVKDATPLVIHGRNRREIVLVAVIARCVPNFSLCSIFDMFYNIE
jgi:hypothetical protein